MNYLPVMNGLYLRHIIMLLTHNVYLLFYRGIVKCIDLIFC